jgi:hypothetical protein
MAFKVWSERLTQQFAEFAAMANLHGLAVLGVNEPGGSPLFHFFDSEKIRHNHFSMSENPWRPKWTQAQLTAMLLEYQQAFWSRETGLERDVLARVKQAPSAPHAVILSGLRHVGKSTLLAQLLGRPTSVPAGPG